MLSEELFWIERCLSLAEDSILSKEAPFSSLITRDNTLLVESKNGASKRISDHAEVLVLDMAHQATGSHNLSDCTLYTICEPCPMCSFMIREYKIQRVVFSLYSPFMGGFSKWQVLQDPEITQFEKYFGPVPEVVGGILEEKSKKIFMDFGLWMFGSTV